MLVFYHPLPGDYQPADADLVLTDGGPGADAFGMELAVGDFDGDGAADLVIGAPNDREDRSPKGPVPLAPGPERSGSATMVFGAGLVGF